MLDRRAAGLLLAILAAAAFLGIPTAAAPAATDRDDTAWLQAKLDAGGRILLKKLPDGACYQTYGLWVSKRGTSISSNGACITYLGPGPARLLSADGDQIAANAVFFVNRTWATPTPPEHISISNLILHVPAATDGYGIVVAGRAVALTGITVDGAPLDGLMITGRANGRGYAGPVEVRRSNFIGARRNGISIIGAVSVTIEWNLITGTGNPTYLGGVPPNHNGPWAGIDIEPDLLDEPARPTPTGRDTLGRTFGPLVEVQRDFDEYPLRSIRIRNNSITHSYGAGILLALATNSGLPRTADQISITRNEITGNGVGPGPPLRGGICIQGGQADGNGRLTVTANEISSNRGFGLCKHPEGHNMRIALSQNSVNNNSDGESNW